MVSAVIAHDLKSMTKSKGNSPTARVIWWNLTIIVGIVLGFMTVPQLPSGNTTARIAIFWLAYFNLVLFVVKPRHMASGRNNDLLQTSWLAITERPIVSLLVVMQLWSAGQAVGSVITLISAYRVAISQHLEARLIVVSTVMSIICALWLAGAFGLWQQKKWGWWLAVILNSLSACTGIVVQVAALAALKPREFLVDPIAIATVVVLLMARTRLVFRVKAAPPLDPLNA
jgi:uncharacterized membrane protein (DUF2068 family)